MKFISLRAAFILLVTVALFNVTKGQVSESQYWYPVEPFRIEVDRKNPEVRELLERWDRIGNEAQGISSGAAGTCLKPAQTGWLLRRGRRVGFVYCYRAEGVSIIDFGYGTVGVMADALQFIPEDDMRETLRDRKPETPL